MEPHRMDHYHRWTNRSYGANYPNESSTHFEKEIERLVHRNIGYPQCTLKSRKDKLNPCELQGSAPSHFSLVVF